VAATPGVREIADKLFPEAGDWVIDRSHSSIAFVVRHLVVAKVKGRFAGFSGTIHIDKEPHESTVEVTIAADSIDTHEPKRDAHLRSADFLDVENHPELTFRGLYVDQGVDPEAWEVAGELTIHGVTGPVVLQMEFGGVTPDPWGGLRAVFSAQAEIEREDWGLDWNQVLEAGGFLVGKEVGIEIEVEAVRKE